MKIAKYNFGLSEYFKPTPRNLRKLGDALLGIMTMVTGLAIFMALPYVPYITLGLGVVGKFLTNYFSEDVK